MGEPRTLYLDVETTGVGSFRPPTQRMLQLAWIVDDGNEVCENSHLISDLGADFFVSPHVPHDITPERCRREGVPFAAAFGALMVDLRRSAAVVAHNLDFDWGTLLNETRLRGLEAEEAELAGLRIDKLCTMRSTVGLCGLKPNRTKRFSGFKLPKLSELHVKLLGEEPAERLHDALNDCRVLRRCHIALRRRLASDGLAV